MSLELTLFRVLKHRTNHDKIIRAVPIDALEERSRIVLKDFSRYFREHPDVDVIEFDPFFLWFKAFAHPTLSTEGKATFEALLRPMEEDVSDAIMTGLMDRLVATRSGSRVAALIERFVEGEEVDLLGELKSAVEEFELDINRKVKTPWVTEDIDDLLKQDANDTGLRFRLDQLNESMRPRRAGDFLIIAARPDVGKTTWLTDDLTQAAEQLDRVFPGEDRNILWFNNEGLGKNIKKRLYQSALGCTIGELLEKQRAGTLKSEYAKATGAKSIAPEHERIRVMDVHDFWNYEVEDVIRQHNPGMIVFDMIDNIKFGGGASNNGQRTDQLLEAMYQWGRILGVKYDCCVMATSQISGDGENMQYPLLGMLKDSKTGKQGAADVILTLGYVNDYPDSRFLGTTKNKLHREGGPKSPRCEVIFDGESGRYKSLAQSQESMEP